MDGLSLSRKLLPVSQSLFLSRLSIKLYCESFLLTHFSLLPNRPARTCYKKMDRSLDEIIAERPVSSHTLHAFAFCNYSGD